MKRAIVGIVCALLCLGSAVAQDFLAGLEAAQAKVDAEQWKDALDILLPLLGNVELGEDAELLASKLWEVGEGLVGQGDLQAALGARTAQLALRKRIHGDRDHPNVAANLRNVAIFLDSLGRADEALPLFETALAMTKRLYDGRDHAHVEMCLSSVASCLMTLGRNGEALPQLEEVLAMQKRLYGDRDNSGAATTLNNIAGCLLSSGRDGEALPQYEVALAMLKRLHGDSDHGHVATGLNNTAFCLLSLGRAGEALPLLEAALAMRKRLYSDRDHPSVAQSLVNIASCLKLLERVDEAVRISEAAQTMLGRLYGDRDHPDLATNLSVTGGCLESLGREDEALPLFEVSLAMRKRLNGDRDHPEVATALINIAGCQSVLGRDSEALRLGEAALEMLGRLYGDRDHQYFAMSLGVTAQCLESLGRADEALRTSEEALAMLRRLYGDRDHAEVCVLLGRVAGSLHALGRHSGALPLFEAALAMGKRLYGNRDHSGVASSLNNIAACLDSLGRDGEALPLYEAALAMWQRVCGGRDHHWVASGFTNVGACLEALGRAKEALQHGEMALAMWKRLYGDRDHPQVAHSLNNVAHCLGTLDRDGESLPLYEAALAMSQRSSGDRDNPHVALGLNGVASCLAALNRAREALPLYETALAMWQRLFGDGDHRDVALGLNNVASCLRLLDRDDEALPYFEAAMTMIERLRDVSTTSPELRQSLFEDLKKGGAFERSQQAASRLGRPMDALLAGERSRGRDLLDQLARVGDSDAEAQRRARLRGDDVAVSRLAALRGEIESAHTDSDRLLHELTTLADLVDDAKREKRREVLLAQSNRGSARLRQLLDERARLLGDVLPVGRVRTAAEIKAALQKDELLLEFTVTEDTALLYVVAREGDVQAIELPAAFATSQRALPTLLQQSSHAQLRGREPGVSVGTTMSSADATSRELFTSLIPAPVWERIRSSKRVFVAAHRDLHRVPFELLVTDVKDGKSVHWLVNGPPISYVPSGTMLHWLRNRAEAAADDATSLDLLAVGDPRKLDVAPEVPEQGVFVVTVNEGSEGARVGLQPGDVLTTYDGTSLADDKALRDVRMATERAIEDGQREKKPIPIGIWRRGSTLTVEVQPGPLGIQVGPGRARAAYEASLGSDAKMERITRAGDLERLGKLPPLLGARAETEAIARVFADQKATTKHLLGADATEPAVFDLAAKAKYLHFACHGIAEEYAGQSLSMLVLSPPPHVLPGDDGLLKLGDLFNAWRGRLASCRLVVLSACRTNVGPTLRDEAPQALPIGFLFAGAPAVISTLWAVDDASTKELMTDFYGRLLAGETDKLAAFTAAKKALRAKYPDPFHWAPFLYMGAPE